MPKLHKEFMQVNDSNILIAANKVVKGINKFEYLLKKNHQKSWFFLKIISLFTL